MGDIKIDDNPGRERRRPVLTVGHVWVQQVSGAVGVRLPIWAPVGFVERYVRRDQPGETKRTSGD